MSMSSADTPTTAFAQPFMRASFHQSVPPQNTMANLRPRSSHGGVSLHHPTVVELHQQIGNLQAQLTGSEDALDRERRRTQRIRAERDDLRQEIGQMTQRIQQQNWTIAELKQKNIDQARELHEQTIKLEKQTKTIKVQSDTISGKQHMSERGPFMTPSHRTTQRNIPDDTPSTSAAAARRAHINDLPPPPFSLGRSQPKASHGPPLAPQPEASDGPSLASQPKSSYGPSFPSQPKSSYGPPLASQQDSVSRALVPYDKPTTSRPHHETRSVVAAHQSSVSSEIDYMGSIQYLFSLTEAWTRNYANIPNVSRDSKLPQPFLETLTALSGSSKPLDLLNDIHTRHYVIAAYINRCVVKKVFVTGALSGFDDDADNKLKVARVELSNNMAPLPTRAAALRSMAFMVNTMKATRGFKEFLKARAAVRGDRLFGELRLTMHEGSNVEAARRELGELMTVGHELTVGMFSMPFEFSFAFPPAGTVFEPSRMVSHDPVVKGDPLTLQRAGVRVRVGVSPVSLKRELGAAANVPQIVHYAKVLLKA